SVARSSGSPAIYLREADTVAPREHDLGWHPLSLIARSTGRCHPAPLPTDGTSNARRKRLREARQAARLTQVDSARALCRPQSFVSKCVVRRAAIAVIELEAFGGSIGGRCRSSRADLPRHLERFFRSYGVEGFRRGLPGA